MCDHTKFDAKVDVDRTINQSDSGKILDVTFRAKVRIKCVECNTEFVFDPRKVSVEDGGQILSAAVEPSTNFTSVIETPPPIPL